jgi:hypothetical protein
MPEDIELDDEMREEMRQAFEGMSTDYIRGYSDGVRDNSKTLMREAATAATVSLVTVELTKKYLKEITSDE